MELSRRIAIYAPLIALAALAVLVVVLLRYRRLLDEGRQVQARRLVAVTLGAWLAVLLAGTLSGGRSDDALPFDLNPFTMNDPLRVVAAEWLLNVALFVPLGILFPLLLQRRRVVTTVAVGAVLSLLVELTQFTFQLNRDPSVTDIICNTVGAFLGTLIGAVLRRRTRRRAELPETDAVQHASE